MLDNNDHWQFIISAVVLSMVGGVANWLMSDKHTIFEFVVAVFLAGFAGFLVGELCTEAKMSESISFFLCGSAGLCAEVVLKLSRKIIIQKIYQLTNQKMDGDLDSMVEEFEKRKSIVEEHNETIEKGHNLTDFFKKD